MSFVTLADFNGGTIPAATVNQWLTGIRQLQAVAIPVKGINVTNAGNPIATSSGTTEMDLAKLQLTGVALTTGRYYEARYLITMVKSVASDAFDLRLRANTAVSGTQIGRLDSFASEPATQSREYGFVFKGDATYTSLYVSVVRTAGTGTIAYYGVGGGFNRTWAQLWDRGDSANWTDVA